MDGKTELQSYDFQGQKNWSIRGVTALLALPGERFLINTKHGRPQVIDGDGTTIHRWQGRGITQARRQGEILLLADERHVYASDLQLRRLWQVGWPDARAPQLGCFVNERFYWLWGDEVRSCGIDGRPRQFAALGDPVISKAVDLYAAAIGRADFGRVYWRPNPSFDRQEDVFFIAGMVRHVMLCLERDGSVRWCQGLAPCCCGGLPSALPNGHFVASGGCAGILSWFDARGNVLVQSRPHEGAGLASAYSGSVTVLGDGRTLVSGGPGLICCSAEGEELWALKQAGHYWGYDAGRGVIAHARWWNTGSAKADPAVLELVGGV